MIKFIKELKSVILNNAPLEEAIIFATDTREMFVDINNVRLQINDIDIVDTVAGLDNILAPLSNKFYFCNENNIFYRHVDGAWVGLTTTQAQYESIVESINNLTVAYEKISQGINTEYILEASKWVDGVYTIHNETLFTKDTTVKLSATGNITEAQYNALSDAKIIPDNSDVENNNLILKATGVVPTIDIPIIISVFIDTDLYSIEDNLTSTSAVNPLSANMGRELNEKIGDLSVLKTTNKDDAVVAINEIYDNVDAGKTALAAAITAKGRDTSATDSFETMSTNISNILAADTTVQTLVASVTTTADEVLEGEKFVNGLGETETGTMPNNTAEQKTLTPGNSYTIAKGYHDGTGTVTAPALKDLTFGTADDYEILAGETAYVNGVEVTGTMPNNTAEQKTLQPGESTTIALGYHDGTGTISVPTLSSLTPGTAEAVDILSGETAYVNGNKVTGTMPNNVAETITLTPISSYTTSYTIAEGYHDGTGSVSVPSLNSLTPGTADATEILSGKTAYVNGTKVTGTMPNNTPEQKKLTPGSSYTIAKGYHDGTGKVTTDSLSTLTPGTADTSEILSGETAYVNGTKVTGTMPNNTAEQKTLQPGESTTIAQGYHDGTGTVSVPTLATLTPGTATSDKILAGETAYVNGVEVTGTMGSNTIYMGTSVPSNDAGEEGDIFLLI